MLRCPWHGWEFDIRTGRSWCDPDDLRVRRFSVQVEEGEALVSESFPVSVEQDYLVVEI